MASSFVIGRPSEVPHYELKPLPDGRWHLKHFTKITSQSGVVPVTFEAKGTLYRGDTAAGTNVEAWAGLRLLDIYAERTRLDGTPEECIIREYEQIPATAEIQAGGLRRVTDDNGRNLIEATFIQFSSAPRTAGTIGTTTAPGDATAVLDNEKCEDDGTLRTITRRYAQATSEEQQVGEDDLTTDENNRQVIERLYIQRASATFSAGVVGTASITVSGKTYALDLEKKTATVAVRTIRRRWIEVNGTLTQVGKNRKVTDANGRKLIEATFVIRTSTSYTGGTVGVTTAPGDTTCVLDSEREEATEVVRTVIRRFAQATATWTALGPDKTDRDLNGLLRVKRLLVAIAGTVPPALNVGTTAYTYGSGPGVGTFLAGYTDADSDLAVSRIEASYLQPGIVRKGRSAGPVKGTVEYTWLTYRLDATSAGDMGGAENVIPGKVVSDEDDNFAGFQMRRFTSIGPAGESDSITGVKLSYTDTRQVSVPGTVSFATIAVSIDPLEGDCPVIDHVPPTTKTISVTVTVEVTTTPPTSDISPAYNMDGIACSITTTQASAKFNGTDSYWTRDGRTKIAGRKWSASISADIQTFPGCVFTGSETASGSFEYLGGLEDVSTDGDSLSVNALNSRLQIELRATAGIAIGYVTSGILERKVRELFSALDGTTFYEVITWTA